MKKKERRIKREKYGNMASEIFFRNNFEGIYTTKLWRKFMLSLDKAKDEKEMCKLYLNLLEK